MAVLLAVYHLLFEREKMHRFNRFYLLLALVLSLAIPFISLPFYSNNTIYTINLQPLILGKNQGAPLQSENYFLLIMYGLYAAVTILLALRFVKNINTFFRKVRFGEVITYKNAKLVLLSEKVLPHTFLNYIFVNKDEYYSQSIEDELYTHELAHVTQQHTLDVIFAEIIKTIFWFNPLPYYYKKAIQLNHEFLADEKVITTFSEVRSYQNLLLMKASGAQGFYLASNLNFAITKKRFIMMTKETPRFAAAARQAILIPVLGVLLLISCTKNEEKSKNTTPEAIKVEAFDQKVYSAADLTTQPEYPGGMSAFYKFVNNNFVIPEVDKDMTAKIYVSFTVEKDGTLAYVKVIRDPGYGLGDEAKRVMEASKIKWKPGTMNGQPVRSSYNLPITINIKVKP